jgi:hypothetical protein
MVISTSIKPLGLINGAFVIIIEFILLNIYSIECVVYVTILYYYRYLRKAKARENSPITVVLHNPPEIPKFAKIGTPN